MNAIKKAFLPFLASLQPKPVLPASIRQAPTALQSLELVSCDAQSADSPQERGSNPHPEQASAALSHEKSAKPSSLEPLGDKRYHLRFAFSGEQLRKLERLAELLGEANLCKNLATVVEKALDIALHAKDPATCRRRKKAPDSAAAANRSRAIPTATRRLVFARGNYQCQFTAPDGIRCGQRSHLCIDHIFPFAQGGSNHLDNLQLLCWSHNNRKIEFDFGFRWQDRSQGTTS